MSNVKSSLFLERPQLLLSQNRRFLSLVAIALGACGTSGANDVAAVPCRTYSGTEFHNDRA